MLKPRRVHLRCVVNQAGGFIYYRHQIKFTRINLGQVQKIIDNIEQEVARVTYFFIPVPVLMRNIFLLQITFGNPQYYVHRGAYFVADVRQEFTLCGIGVLGLF